MIETTIVEVMSLEGIEIREVDLEQFREERQRKRFLEDCQ